MVLLAGVLTDYGVKKGDTVVVYMPMVPEAVFVLLACARLGAVHSVVFGKVYKNQKGLRLLLLLLKTNMNFFFFYHSIGGFAPKELAKRIDDAKPKVLVTASCGIEPKRVIPYKRKCCIHAMIVIICRCEELYHEEKRKLLTSKVCICI